MKNALLALGKSFVVLALASIPLHAAEQKVPGGQKQPEQKPRSGILPDLTVHWIGVTPAGSVIYQVANGSKESTRMAFVVEVYLNGIRKDVIRHEPLPAMSVQVVESKLARLTECQDASARVVVDTEKNIREQDENNNERTMSLTPPCAKRP
jgi:hypothetical protein